MSRVNELHDEAMETSDRAFLAKRRGQMDEFLNLSRRAFELEKEAALVVVSDLDAEPTRSILLRSAASLAIDCNEIREAERLIAIALSGNPPPEIAEELRDLLEQVHFERHLALRDIGLDPNEMQFAIAGNVTGYGIALSQAFVDRVKDMEKVIFRTVERLLGNDYRERGSAKTSVTSGYQLFISAPRPGSFSVTLRLGRQMSLPGFDLSTEVIQEVVECFTLLNNNQEDVLRQRIPQEAYYQNFVGLARKIAPDGEDINIVSLTATQGEQTRGVAFTRQQQNISLASGRGGENDKDGELNTIQITGELKYANAIGSNQIRIVDEKNKSRTILVPEGLMTDIVRPLWEDKVTVTVSRRNGKLYLVDIAPSNSE